MQNRAAKLLMQHVYGCLWSVITKAKNRKWTKIKEWKSRRKAHQRAGEFWPPICEIIKVDIWWNEICNFLSCLWYENVRGNGAWWDKWVDDKNSSRFFSLSSFWILATGLTTLSFAFDIIHLCAFRHKLFFKSFVHLIADLYLI